MQIYLVLTKPWISNLEFQTFLYGVFMFSISISSYGNSEKRLLKRAKIFYLFTQMLTDIYNNFTKKLRKLKFKGAKLNRINLDYHLQKNNFEIFIIHLNKMS